jgi:hypothetical protein
MIKHFEPNLALAWPVLGTFIVIIKNMFRLITCWSGKVKEYFFGNHYRMIGKQIAQILGQYKQKIGQVEIRVI